MGAPEAVLGHLEYILAQPVKPSLSCCQAGWASAVTPSRKGQGHSSQDSGGTLRPEPPAQGRPAVALPAGAYQELYLSPPGRGQGVPEPTCPLNPAQSTDFCGSGNPHTGRLL